VVPAGFVVVVRNIDVSSGGGAIINWEASINAVARFAGGQFTIEALNQFATWRGHCVLNAGEALVVSADGPIDGAVTGYLLVAGP
jgi:hypothetical protein